CWSWTCGSTPSCSTTNRRNVRNISKRSSPTSIGTSCSSGSKPRRPGAPFSEVNPPARASLRLFPLNTVLFPGAVLNLHVFEERYRRLIAECLDTGEAFGVVLLREGEEAGDPDAVPHDVGTTAEIAEV